MLTDDEVDYINRDQRLVAIVRETVKDYKRTVMKHIYVPSDRDEALQWDVYLDGVKLERVCYVDTQLGIVRQYIAPYTIKNGEVLTKESIGEVRMQQRFSIVNAV